MGGIKNGMDQQLVAKGMEQDFDPQAPPANNPAFLYLVGDCVYYNGEVKQYYSQFYEPYEFYPRPYSPYQATMTERTWKARNLLRGFSGTSARKRQ